MKITTLTPQVVDSTSFYRAYGVFGNLKRKYIPELIINSVEKMGINWTVLAQSDAVFMQRPFKDEHLQIATYIKEMRIPLWMDYDDLLLNVPIDNPAHSIYGNPQIKKNIIELIKLADVVSVSTANLKTALSSLNSNIKIIPNAFNDELFNYRNQTRILNDVVLWRGSNTHLRDLLDYYTEISDNTTRYLNWKWEYLGFMPFFIAEIGTKNISASEPIDPILYHKKIHQIAPKCMQIPLRNSTFNQCKSNIAFIEGSFAGAVCIVPDWPEWDMPGVLKYKDSKQYGANLEAVCKGEVDVFKMNKSAWEHISTNLSLSKINELRMNLIKELI